MSATISPADHKRIPEATSSSLEDAVPRKFLGAMSELVTQNLDNTCHNKVLAMIPSFLSLLDGLVVGRKLVATGEIAAPVAASLAAAFTVYRNSDVSGLLSVLGLDTTPTTFSDSLPSKRWFTFQVSSGKSLDLSQAVPVVLAQLCGIHFPDAVGEVMLVSMAAGLALTVAAYLVGRGQGVPPTTSSSQYSIGN